MLDPDKDATSKEDIWAECAERLRICMAHESANRLRGIEAKRFRWGDQWPDDIRNTRANRPSLTINHTNVACQRQENTLRQQRPRIKVHPVGDGADIDTAATAQGLIRHIEYRSNASIAYDLGVKNAIDIGWGYWRIRSEYIGPKSRDQELIIDPIRNPFSVYMDPGSKYPDGRDQRWCIISEQIKRKEYKLKYAKYPLNDYSYIDAPGDIGQLRDSWEGKEEIRLAEYYRIHDVPETLVMMSDGQMVYKSDLPTPEIMQATNWLPQLGEDQKPIERKTTRTVVQCFRLNGSTVIDQYVIPGRYIPIIRCEGNVDEIDGEIVRKGMIEDMMDPARMLNYWRSSQTERYALAPKAPWVVAEGQLDGHPEWNDANTKSYSTLVYKPATVMTSSGEQVLPPPMRQPPAQVESGMSEAAAGAEHDLMSVAGMPQENPQIASQIIGGNKYLQRRQGMQDLAHFQYYDNQTLSIAWTGSILLEMIPYYYDTKRIQRIIGEDGVPTVVTLNDKSKGDDGVERIKNDMTVGMYSVVMDTGPGYVTKREEAAENMVQTLSTPLGSVIVQQGADIVLRNMDFHGASELADRVAVTIPGAMDEIIQGLPKQAQNMIAALKQQMQQKDQTIQQQSLEINYGKDKEKMRIHGKLEEIDRHNENRIQVQTMKDTTSRDVADIHGATQLLNTNAEAGHDRSAARDLIDAGTRDRP